MIKKTRVLLTISATAAAIVGMLISAGSAFAAAPTFAQSSYTIGIGQTTTITTQNGVSVYMTANSAPSAASVSTNGAQITLTGIGLGNSSLTFCEVGTALNCANLGVIVQANAVTNVSLSQNNVSLSVGSNQSIAISGGNGSYSIASNSNTAAVSTSLSGTNLTVSGLAAGSTTISICDTANSCASLSATVSSAASGLTFSANNLSLTMGSTQIVTVSGGNGAYNISSTSNSNIASASISGNAGNNILVSASSASGSASINVCDSANVCGTLSVTVSAPTTNQVISFSVPSPTLAAGQTLSVTLTNTVAATGYIVLTNTAPGVAQASLDNSNLSLSGVSAGTDLLVICTIGGGGCNQLNVTVTGTGTASAPATAAAPATTTAAPAVTPTTVTQPGATVVSPQILSQIQNIKALLAQALSQIQSAQSQLAQLETQLNSASASSAGANASLSPGTFTELLAIGSQDDQVTALQKKLTALGFYSGPVTGYYGSLTREGVIKYQAARGITATGSLGPSTRDSLNAE
ncbi:MAG TPA: peptidoglycan-binding domain-containing protein [Candidatus Paceibacterota bacterium]|nr:peptidoglycan-binding domain-containing protein [Candidatus Paceibacterota bacterium]